MINDKDYWNQRFSTDWNYYGGNEQTAMFARMLVDNLPCSVVTAILEGKLSMVDFGCAQGECASIMKSRFPQSHVTGVDFSKVAIDIATKKFPNCAFEVRDVTVESVPCDVAVCSNVLEHLERPDDMMEMLFRNASRFVVVLVPFREGEIRLNDAVKCFLTKISILLIKYTQPCTFQHGIGDHGTSAGLQIISFRFRMINYLIVHSGFFIGIGDKIPHQIRKNLLQ